MLSCFFKLEKNHFFFLGIRGKGSNLIAQLLLRKINLSSGALFLAERDISSYSHNYLYKNIGVVPENPIIFGATIKYI